MMYFPKDICADSPVPAAGAAVAYTSCLAIALLYKVVILELLRATTKEVCETSLRVARREMEKLLRDAEKLVEEGAKLYTDFARSYRNKDKKDIKQHFSKVIDVSMKVLEKSSAALEWASQLNRISENRMRPHFKVACELLMGAINGSAHVARANFQTIKHQEKEKTIWTGSTKFTMRQSNNIKKSYQSLLLISTGSPPQKLWSRASKPLLSIIVLPVFFRNSRSQVIQCLKIPF
jgi:formiminotetrahydrofolate cyclodeaminase